MMIEQYQKFIDTTLLAAAVTYFNEQALVAVQNGMQRIINQYKFTPNATDTDKEFQNQYLYKDSRGYFAGHVRENKEDFEKETGYNCEKVATVRVEWEEVEK